MLESKKTADPSGAHDKAKKKRGSGARAEIRRAEILKAAFEVFSEHGFAQARLDEVARRAGIAKGTIYLYFSDKEALFVELLRETAQPVLGGMQAVAAMPDISVREVVDRIHTLFVSEILGSPRKHLLRLLMQEGPRFPQIAEFYSREIVSKGMAVIARLGRKGYESGELTSDALARFPQILMAPLLMSVVWDSLFENEEHLDVEAMLAAYRTLLTGAQPPDRQGGTP